MHLSRFHVIVMYLMYMFFFIMKLIQIKDFVLLLDLLMSTKLTLVTLILIGHNQLFSFVACHYSRLQMTYFQGIEMMQGLD